MIRSITFRRWKSGVTPDEYWRAVESGQRETVLEPPAPLPPAAYGTVRDLVAAFGGTRQPEKVGEPDPDQAGISERIALWDREWAGAEPMAPPGPPPSPLERRQFRPRVRQAPGGVSEPRPKGAPAGPAPHTRPHPAGSPPVAWPLRSLVASPRGADWWNLQIAGLGGSSAARAAYAEALRGLRASGESPSA